MKKLTLIICLLFSVCAFAQIDKIVPSRPSPPRLVNDFSNKLTPEQADALERKLVAYDDSTSNQIAIVILPTVTDESGNEYSIEEVGLKILRDWQVGTKKNNNGIVIVVAIKEHKIRIETGYGLEGAVPDMTAISIIDNDLTPNFRADNYYRGLDAATNSIMQAAAGEYKAEPRKKGKKTGGILGKVIAAIVILFFVFGMGGGGGRGGGYVSRRGSSWIGPMILGSMLGRASGGGFGGGGGGFGGGGFGGFGGGSGGGGGASGSW